jgi:hypothetical protein
MLAPEVQAIIKTMTQTKAEQFTKSWHLAEVSTSIKGQKSCQLTAAHKPVTFNLGSSLKTRFGANTFDKNVESTRKNLDFDITGDKQIQEVLEGIDKWTVQYILDNGGKFMKKVMTKEVIKEHYKPLLSSYGDRLSVKTKINIGGSRVCRCWDENKDPRDLPENWLSNKYDVRVSLPQLWIMGSDFGWTLECTDLLVQADDAECPF